MDRIEFQKVAEAAAMEKDCLVADIIFNDDDNIFEIVLAKTDGSVDLSDCEYVHRAVLDAFDRNVEDYALTVGSQGIGPEEADAIMRGMDE